MDLPRDDSAAAQLVLAIHLGDLRALRRLLDLQPALAGDHLSVAGGRTPLHIVTDWPGYFPEGPAVVRLLLAAGADPNVRGEGDKGETPLHWAASSDDVDVADALIDGGADVDSPGGSIGTPLDNAVGYGCWNVARRLVARGVRVDKLWHAAALGLLDRMDELLEARPAPGREDINAAFWQACHGGQLRAAALLLSHGADIHAVPGYATGGTVLEIAAGPDTRRDLLLGWLRDQGADRDRGRT